MIRGPTRETGDSKMNMTPILSLSTPAGRALAFAVIAYTAMLCFSAPADATTGVFGGMANEVEDIFDNGLGYIITFVAAIFALYKSSMQFNIQSISGDGAIGLLGGFGVDAAVAGHSLLI